MKIFNQFTKILYSSIPFVILSLPIFMILSGYQLKIENSIVYLVAIALVLPLMMVLMNLYYLKQTNPSNLFNQYFSILKKQYLNYLKFVTPFILIIGYLLIVMSISFQINGINTFGCMLIPFVLMAFGWFLFMMITRISFDQQINDRNILVIGSKYWLANLRLVFKSIFWSLIGFLIVMLFGPIFKGFAIAILLFIITNRMSQVSLLIKQSQNDYKKVK